MSEWLLKFYCQQCFPCCVLCINHISFQDNRYSFVKVTILAALSETLSPLAKKLLIFLKKNPQKFNKLSLDIGLLSWALYQTILPCCLKTCQDLPNLRVFPRLQCKDCFLFVTGIDCSLHAGVALNEECSSLKKTNTLTCIAIIT